MSTVSLQARIEEARKKFHEQTGQEGKTLLLGATELKEFIDEFYPSADADPESITTTQFVQFLGFRVVIVMKTSYVGVC